MTTKHNRHILQVSLIAVFLMAVLSVVGMVGLMSNGAALPQYNSVGLAGKADIVDSNFIGQAGKADIVDGNLAGRASYFADDSSPETTQEYRGGFVRGAKAHEILISLQTLELFVSSDGTLSSADLQGGPQRYRAVWKDAHVSIDIEKGQAEFQFPEQAIILNLR